MSKIAFSKFCQENFTLTVVISVVMFRFLNSFLDNCCMPAILSFVDPDHHIRDYSIQFRNGDEPIEIGKFFKDFISLTLFLLIVYYVSNM